MEGTDRGGGGASLNKRKVLGSAESFDLLKTRPHVTSCAESRVSRKEKKKEEKMIVMVVVVMMKKVKQLER